MKDMLASLPVACGHRVHGRSAQCAVLQVVAGASDKTRVVEPMYKNGSLSERFS
jgi:hypothetical protein